MKWTLVQTVWVVFAASLVFLAQAGYAAREAGLVRSKNAMSVVLKLLCGTLVATLVMWAAGAAFLLGEGSGWIGTSGFLGGIAAGDPGQPAQLVLHAALACAAASVLSGAVSERIRQAP
jgi:Amt family ammonium transporter